MTEDQRIRQMKALIRGTAWANIEPQLLPNDASFRQYHRLQPTENMLAMPSAMIMDAPPEHEDVKPFIAVAERLSALGYSAPKIFEHNISKGLLLLEDFGDDSFNKVVSDSPVREHELYSAAVDLLVDLHCRALHNPLPISVRRKHTVPAYDEKLLSDEASLLLQWHMNAVYGEDAERDEAFNEAIRHPLSKVTNGKRVLVLRDYHADNLMWLPTRTGVQRVGLLDFQDALIGHPAYDLVSLLQDCRRDIKVTLERAMIDRYCRQIVQFDSEFDETLFRQAYAILGAQRNAKIIGIFTRLCLRDGKSDYLKFIPRSWGLLERNLTEPCLGPLRQWLRNYTKTGDRRKMIRPESLKGISHEHH